MPTRGHYILQTSNDKNMLFLSTDDEYRVLVDKYTNVRNDFETRMIVACKVGRS